MRDCTNILRFVSENIPYYKRMGKEAGLADYPIVNKYLIRDHYEDFLPVNLPTGDKEEILKVLKGNFNKKGKSINEVYDFGKYTFEETTGTSGIPFRVVKSKEDRVRAGLSVWKKRREIDPYVSPGNLLRFNHTGIHDVNLEPYNYDEKHIMELYDFVDKSGARWLHVSPNPLTEHVKILQRANKFRFKDLKYIECTGNFYSNEQKELFEETFHAKVINQYGSIETWPLAYSCDNGKMQVLNNRFIEILDDDGRPITESDTIGNIVITCLDLHTLPFVRYKIGDYGKWADSKCFAAGASQVIEIIPGRDFNIIKGLEKKSFGNIFFS